MCWAAMPIRVKAQGAIVEPTIFTGVNNQMRIAQEEVFGPFYLSSRLRMKKMRYKSVMISPRSGCRGVDIGYGTAIRMSERLRAGTVWVNTIVWSAI